MVITCIILISLLIVFGMHLIVCLATDTKLKYFYTIIGRDETIGLFIVALSIMAFLVAFMTLCAINNTYLHLPY